MKEKSSFSVVKQIINLMLVTNALLPTDPIKGNKKHACTVLLLPLSVHILTELDLKRKIKQAPENRNKALQKAAIYIGA